MNICPTCQNENDDLAVKCSRCGVYLKNPRFNFFNFEYDYFFTHILGNKWTATTILKAAVVWFLAVIVLGGIGYLILPLVKDFGKLLGPDVDPKDPTASPPPWVIIGSILGVLLGIYICYSVKINNVVYLFREWLTKKFSRKT